MLVRLSTYHPDSLVGRIQGALEALQLALQLCVLRPGLLEELVLALCGGVELTDRVDLPPLQLLLSGQLPAQALQLTALLLQLVSLALQGGLALLLLGPELLDERGVGVLLLGELLALLPQLLDGQLQLLPLGSHVGGAQAGRSLLTGLLGKGGVRASWGRGRGEGRLEVREGVRAF